jgi:hypothetical protein
MWNSLNNNIRNVDTLSKFKSELKKIDETENHAVVVTMLILSINVVLACKYIGQFKKKCFKFSWAAPHRQDGSDTIPTRNKS